jgi:alpha-amylase/alpha-mannosidase (GH57 family)
MNERIKELMDEVIEFRLDPDSKHYEAQVNPEHFEMFAELIVKECADICLRQSRSGWNDDRKTQARLDRDLINEHFGVEE